MVDVLASRAIVGLVCAGAGKGRCLRADDMPDCRHCPGKRVIVAGLVRGQRKMMLRTFVRVDCPEEAVACC